MLARLAVLAALLLAPAFARGQALADRVPGDAMIYLGWRGADDLGPGYDQSNLKAVLADSQIPQFINEFLPALMDKVGQLNPEAGAVTPIIAAIAKPTWHHPTALFFSLAKGAHGEPMPHGGAIWQAGADADALAGQLQQLAQNANAPIPIKVLNKDHVVALTVGYDDPEAALAGGGNKSLADSDTFKNCLSRVIQEPTAVFYEDIQAILALANDAIKQAPNEQAARIWPQFRDTLGLKSLKRIMVASGFEGKDWGTQAFVEAPQPRTGLFKLIGGKPLDNDILSAIPKGATSAGAGRFNLAGVLPLVRQLAAAVDPNARQQLDQILQNFTQASEVDVQKDLLDSLGDEWAAYTDPMLVGRGLASLTVVNHLKDPAKFEQAMSKVEDFALAQIQEQIHNPMIHLSFETADVDGMKIHYLAIPLLAPSWVVHNGNLYIAAFPQVAAAAARQGAGRNGSILQNPGFVALRQRLGQSNPSSFSFSDLPKTAPDAYSTWLLITRAAGFGDVFGVKSPPMILPELSKLEAHLAPAGSVGWEDADGLHGHAIEPFPGSTVVASDPAMMALYAIPMEISVILPALNRAREQANRVKSASNLRQIGMGAIMYANNHNQKFPPDLGTMAQEEDLAASVFKNPRVPDRSPPPPANPKSLSKWINQNSDYVWVGAGKDATAGADVPLAYEKPEQNAEGVNILYADGHVEFVVMPEARQQIQKARHGGNAPANGAL